MPESDDPDKIGKPCHPDPGRPNSPGGPCEALDLGNTRCSLRQAYLSTHYIVDAHPPFTLIIGETSAALLALYKARGVDCCAYLTACNPHSRPLDTRTNAERQAVLIHELRQHGIDYLEGRGRHPDGNWPAEPSILALGIDEPTACVLGKKYEQNALVLCGPDGVPRLVWL